MSDLGTVLQSSSPNATSPRETRVRARGHVTAANGIRRPTQRPAFLLAVDLSPPGPACLAPARLTPRIAAPLHRRATTVWSTPTSHQGPRWRRCLQFYRSLCRFPQWQVRGAENQADEEESGYKAHGGTSLPQ